MKPFKPLTFKRPETLSTGNVPEASKRPIEVIAESPPPKKRRLIHVVNDVEAVETKIAQTKAATIALSAPRKPLVVVKNPAVAPSSKSCPEGYFLVLW